MWIKNHFQILQGQISIIFLEIKMKTRSWWPTSDMLLQPWTRWIMCTGLWEHTSNSWTKMTQKRNISSNISTTQVSSMNLFTVFFSFKMMFNNLANLFLCINGTIMVRIAKAKVEGHMDYQFLTSIWIDVMFFKGRRMSPLRYDRTDGN